MKKALAFLGHPDPLGEPLWPGREPQATCGNSASMSKYHILEGISLASVSFLCSAVSPQFSSTLGYGIPSTHKQAANDSYLRTYLLDLQLLQLLHISLLAAATKLLKSCRYQFPGSSAISLELFQEASVPNIPLRQLLARLAVTSIIGAPIILVNIISRGMNCLYVWDFLRF